MLTAVCVGLDLKWPLFLLYFNQGWYCPRTYRKSLTYYIFKITC